jgi:hypothetical protein
VVVTGFVVIVVAVVVVGATVVVVATVVVADEVVVAAVADATKLVEARKPATMARVVTIAVPGAACRLCRLEVIFSFVSIALCRLISPSGRALGRRPFRYTKEPPWSVRGCPPFVSRRSI